MKSSIIQPLFRCSWYLVSKNFEGTTCVHYQLQKYLMQSIPTSYLIPDAMWASLFVAYSLKALSRWILFCCMLDLSLEFQKTSMKTSIIGTTFVQMGTGWSWLPIVNSLKLLPSWVLWVTVWSIVAISIATVPSASNIKPS